MAKSVMIDKDLFIDICKFFLMGDEYADYHGICEALSAKIDSLSEREAYARRLQHERRPNAVVEAPAAVNKAKRIIGSVVDMQRADLPGERYTLYQHGTCNVLGQLDAPEAQQVFAAVNAGELVPTPENCGDSYIIL